jgi:uncharacterized protein YoxC
MSEVINKIHDLQKRVFELEEQLRHARTKYAEEVDHSDELANLVRELSKVANGAFFISSKSLLDQHEQRRIQDDIDENGLSVEG